MQASTILVIRRLRSWWIWVFPQTNLRTLLNKQSLAMMFKLLWDGSSRKHIMKPSRNRKAVVKAEGVLLPLKKMTDRHEQLPNPMGEVPLRPRGILPGCGGKRGDLVLPNANKITPRLVKKMSLNMHQKSGQLYSSPRTRCGKPGRRKCKRR
jgi:hypothetical protein